MQFWYVIGGSKYCDVLKTFYEFFSSGCDASKNDADCCTSSFPCAIGDGDCDEDEDCDGDLICGIDNCQYFDSAWPGTTTDCCTTGKKITQL